MARVRACLSSSLSLIASALLLLTFFAASAARAQTAPIDIPTVGSSGFNNVQAISKNGIVAGQSYSGIINGSYGYIWQNNVLTGIGNPINNQYFTVAGVNNSGMVAGNISNPDGSYTAFTWTAAGGVVPLTIPTYGYHGGPVQPGDTISLTPTAINNNGMVIGYLVVSDHAGYDEEVVVWPPNGTPIVLPPLGLFSASPAGLNDAGQVVVGYDDSNNMSDSYVWSQTAGVTDLGEGIIAQSINSGGQVAGYIAYAQSGANDLFVWSAQSGVVDLGPPPPNPNQCAAMCQNGGSPNVFINDNGEIAGRYSGSMAPYGVVWMPGFTSVQALTALISGTPGSLGEEDYVQAINAGGQIVGYGTLPNVGQQAEYWAGPSALPLALGAGFLGYISDTGLAAGTDITNGFAAVWDLNGTVTGISPVTVTFSTPANNATYFTGQSVPTSFACIAANPITSCTGVDDLGNTYNSGDPLNTNTAGTRTLTVTGTSSAGVSGSYSISYTINSTPPITGAKMHGYGALAAPAPGDLYRFNFNVEDTQSGNQAGRFDLWTVDRNGQPRIANTFEADSISSVMFSTNGYLPVKKAGHPLADTVTFAGTGEFNDVSGYTFTATAVDHGLPGVGQDTYNITVTDSNNNVVFSAMGLLDAGDIYSSRLGATPPPIITDGPPPVTQLEATGPNGAVDNYSAATATDFNGNPVPVVCTPVSGSTFPLGVIHGTCVATDSRGRTSAIRFRVRVKDTTPPVFSSAQVNITVPATKPGGAEVTYSLPTASDLVDPSPTVSCEKASGKTFAIGVTTVTCTAKDSSGIKSTATFTVTVTDTIPPTIAIASPTGSYSIGQAVTASFSCSDPASGVASCIGSQANGATIITGTAGKFTFTVTAVDGAGNSASKTVNYTVKK
jgi:hypothetical protein